MKEDRNAVLFGDPDEADLEALLRQIRDECEALAALLPAARGAQWSASPVPRPREDTAERAKGGHGDPTPSLALDTRRLALRAQVLRSERVVREGLTRVRGVRRGLERTLDAWEGVSEKEGASP